MIPLPKLSVVDLLQLVGLAVALVGLFLLAGIGWTLLVAGLVATVIGALLEVQSTKSAADAAAHRQRRGY